MIGIVVLEKNFYSFNPSFASHDYPAGKFKESISKFKISLINPYFCRPHFGRNSKFVKLASKVSDRYTFRRFDRINSGFVGLRVGVYQGFRFSAFRIRSEVVGSFFADFVWTYKLSPNIGLKKKRGFTGIRNKPSASHSIKKISQKK